MISILASDRLWIKARVGIDIDQIALLPEAIQQVAAYQQPWSVTDTLEHERMAVHPLVTGEVGMRSCAGAPIIDPQGATIGMLLVMDTVPHEFSADELHILADLAAIVVSELELRVDARIQGEINNMRDELQS
jgi:GAF domain-containing protein